MAEACECLQSGALGSADWPEGSVLMSGRKLMLLGANSFGKGWETLHVNRPAAFSRFGMGLAGPSLAATFPGMGSITGLPPNPFAFRLQDLNDYSPRFNALMLGMRRFPGFEPVPKLVELLALEGCVRAEISQMEWSSWAVAHGW